MIIINIPFYSFISSIKLALGGPLEEVVSSSLIQEHPDNFYIKN